MNSFINFHSRRITWKLKKKQTKHLVFHRGKRKNIKITLAKISEKISDKELEES